MNHIFLSPHYDDAVYSCGGKIYQLIQSGEDVTIFTLMAGIPTLPLPDTPIIKDNHERWDAGENPVLLRRTEDQAAAKLLGANTRYADLLDCIYRVVDGDALYATEEDLWAGNKSNDTALEDLRTLELDSAATIYAPLAVGSHVDHIITRKWARELKHNGYQIIFYEDYPYMRQKRSVYEILDTLALSVGEYLAILDEAAIHAKIAAMKAYQSQITTFWDSEAAMESEIRATFTDPESQQIRERYWRVSD